MNDWNVENVRFRIDIQLYSLAIRYSICVVCVCALGHYLLPIDIIFFDLIVNISKQMVLLLCELRISICNVSHMMICATCVLPYENKE